MQRFLFSILLIGFIFAAAPVDPTSLFNKTYIDVIKTIGFPNAMFPVRQSVPDKDDIVFNYQSSYFYFYNNKLYRIFYSKEYEYPIFPGLKIGDSKANLVKKFGSKYTLEKEGLTWNAGTQLVIATLENNKLKTLWLITKVEK